MSKTDHHSRNPGYDEDPRRNAYHRSGAGRHGRTNKARRRLARQHQRRILRERREEEL